MVVKKALRINHCVCPICQRGDPYHPKHIQHRQINLLMSTMNARQRRLFATYEAERIGLGGISQLARITGLDRKTIRKGANELLINI